MATRLIFRLLLATTLSATLSRAQTTTKPKPCAPSNQPTPAKPCTESPQPQPPREQFPFPKEDSRNAPNPEALPPDAPVYKPDAEDVAPAHAPASGTSQPFPTQPAPDLPGESSSSSSSSSAAPSGSADSTNSAPPQDSNAPGLIDEGSEGVSTRRRKLPKVARAQSDDERFMEDLTVAKFYRGRGNFSAAYQRLEDAVKTDPKDPEAHCQLGEIAQKLEKRDQATSEYQACLKLEPDERQTKVARKGLAQLK